MSAEPYDPFVQDPVTGEWHLASSRRPAVLATVPSALTVVGLDTIKPRAIEWLWPGRVPLGKVTIVDGDPGLGKSTVMLDIACRGSRGQPTPTGESMGDPFVSLIVSSEDAADDTIVPRIIRAGGDLTMIKLITDLTIPDQIDLLEQAIRDHRARFVVIDPLVAYLAEQVKTQIDQQVRRALRPLAEMAERTRVATAGLRHLSKEQRAAIYRGGGSIGFSGLARSVLAFGTDPEDDELRIIASVKLNVGRRPASLAYRLQADGPYEPAYIAWTGESRHDAESLIGLSREEARERTKAERMAEAMVEIVVAAGGSILAVRGYEQLEELGFDLASDDLKNRARAIAKKRLEITKDGFAGPWLWRLLETPEIGEIGVIDSPNSPKTPIKGGIEEEPLSIEDEYPPSAFSDEPASVNGGVR